MQISVEAFTTYGASTSASGTASLTVNAFAQLPTSGNDALLWTGGNIDAGGGTDTIGLQHGENLSGTDLDARLSNVEALDLNDNDIDTLSASDVLGIAGPASILSILGDGGDSVTFSAGWKSAGSQEIGGIDYAIYTSSVGTTDVELRVQDSVVVD